MAIALPTSTKKIGPNAAPWSSGTRSGLALTAIGFGVMSHSPLDRWGGFPRGLELACPRASERIGTRDAALPAVTSRRGARNA